MILRKAVVGLAELAQRSCVRVAQPLLLGRDQPIPERGLDCGLGLEERTARLDCSYSLSGHLLATWKIRVWGLRDLGLH